MFAVPSLKPIRLRGVACARLVVGRASEAELRPADGHRAAADPREVAHGVEGDLRVVRAGLDAEVAVAARRVELVAGQGGQVRQRGRPVRREAEAVVEEPGAEAERDR